MGSRPTSRRPPRPAISDDYSTQALSRSEAEGQPPATTLSRASAHKWRMQSRTERMAPSLDLVTCPPGHFLQLG